MWPLFSSDRRCPPPPPPGTFSRSFPPAPRMSSSRFPSLPSPAAAGAVSLTDHSSFPSGRFPPPADGVVRGPPSTVVFPSRRDSQGSGSKRLRAPRRNTNWLPSHQAVVVPPPTIPPPPPPPPLLLLLPHRMAVRAPCPAVDATPLVAAEDGSTFRFRFSAHCRAGARGGRYRPRCFNSSSI